jgi:hypothetical protein
LIRRSARVQLAAIEQAEHRPRPRILQATRLAGPQRDSRVAAGGIAGAAMPTGAADSRSSRAIATSSACIGDSGDSTMWRSCAARGRLNYPKRSRNFVAASTSICSFR